MEKIIRLTPRQREILLRMAAMGRTWKEKPDVARIDTITTLVNHGLLERRKAAHGVQYRVSESGVQQIERWQRSQTQAGSASVGDGTGLDMPAMRLAGRIRVARLLSGMTQGDLAKASRTSRGTITMMEGLSQGLSMAQVFRIAAALNVPPYLLLAPDDQWQNFIKERT